MSNMVRANGVCVHTYHKAVVLTDSAAGPIVRVAPNTLSFNSHQAYLDIYGRNANNSKDQAYMALSASRGRPNLLSAIDKTVASFKRRVYLQVFSQQGMKQLEDRLLSHFDAFTSLLNPIGFSKTGTEKDGWSSPINMVERCIWLTHDVITELCFSRSSGMQASPDRRHLPSVTRFMSFRGILV